MKTNQLTITELERLMEQDIRKVSSHAVIEHGGGCECAGKKLYGLNTTVSVPHGIPVTNVVQNAFKAIVERYYAPVVRVIKQRPVQDGCSGKVWTPIVLIHEDSPE